MELTSKEINSINKTIENTKAVFGKEAFIYMFTNEYISAYLPLFVLNKKDIMTVIGSGDHVLNILLSDISTLDCFDVNEFAYYYLILKKYALISLTKDEFIKFFFYDGNNGNANFDLNLYAKIRASFEEKDKHVLAFFDYIVKQKNIKRTNLFSLPNSLDKIYDQNLYFKDSNYSLLKDKLREFKIRYINANIKNLHLSNEIGTYDYIFISNITEYLSYIFKNDEVKAYKNLLINDFDKLVKPNGQVVSYQFNNMYSGFSTNRFISGNELASRLGYYFQNERVLNDSILVYTKKR